MPPVMFRAKRQKNPARTVNNENRNLQIRQSGREKNEQNLAFSMGIIKS